MGVPLLVVKVRVLSGLRRALADGVAVGAVVAGHVIVVAQGRAGADDLGLLADRQVDAAGDLRPLGGPLDGLFEVTDPEHPYEIGPDELEAAATEQRTPVRSGDAVLVRTGWGRYFDNADAFVGAQTGAPGIGLEAARWLAERRVRLVGADTLVAEVVGPGATHSALPVHRVLLVDHGINLVEVMDLDELAAAAVHEFVFVLSPLRLVGATGSPVRPLALRFGELSNRERATT